MCSLIEFNVDLAVEYVKNIYENILCSLCDKLDLPRIRYSCGHSLCENCFNASVGCYICLTSPEPSASAKPEYDAVLTQQVKNVSHLIYEFQEAFNIDVYKRKRLSEHLKIEKELFPQCIQAPLKYYNKRKSYNKSYTGKENYHSKFLGEDISPVKINKMENSANYVQNWLNKNDNNRKRKPLADINLHNANIKCKSQTLNLKTNSSLNIKKGYDKKQRKHSQIPFKPANSLVESQNSLDNFSTAIKIKKDLKDIPMEKSNKFYTKEIKKIDIEEKDESGIVMDDDTFIMIEESQFSVDTDKSLSNSVVDKDQNALLQVIKASKYEQDFIMIEESQFSVNTDKSLSNSMVDKDQNTLLKVIKASKYEQDSVIVNRIFSSEVEIHQTNENIINNEFYQKYKVPYYKMSYLQENCYLCSNEIHVRNIAKSKGPSKDASVTIDNNSFTATIRVTNNIENVKKLQKISVHVQTDIVDFYNNCDKELENKSELVTKLIDMKSQELFTGEEVSNNVDKNIFDDLNIEFEKRKCVIIEESDSSEDMEDSKVLEVKADVHRSCEQFEYDILRNVENIEEHTNRPRRRPRGHTPDSSNSSDKENFDPNRSKRLKNSKKACYKK